MNDTSTLRARMHESAIGRVTRMFAATLADIFTETLQNARRAGATRVRVTFDAMPTESADAIRSALETAARHYPLPVFFEHGEHTPPGGAALARRAFLDGAVHVERWRGLVFGVFPDRVRRQGFNEPDVNFHGLTVNVRLPEVGTVHGGTWYAAADIEDCPELEFVLPARKEAVETPFLAEMRQAARLAIYRALAADPCPRPAFDDWKRARDAGIEIAPPPRQLRPWRPDIADVDDWREPPKLQHIVPDALIVACDPEPPEAQALWRAAEHNDVAHRLFGPVRRLEGYGWYDAIPRVTGLRTDVTAGGRTCPLDAYPVPERTGACATTLPERPEAIRIRLTVRASGGPDRMLDLPADAAFAGEAWSWIDDALPLVTADSQLDPRELADLLRRAFFCPSDDSGADSRETQRDEFEREALHMATRLLVSDDEARRRSIADAVSRDLFWLMPPDRGVDIAVRNRRVTVTLGEPAASGPGRAG